VIFYAVVLRVLGKGLVMRFNPLLLSERYGLTPLALTSVVALAQLISIGSPICLTALSTRAGRAPVMVAARVIEPLALRADASLIRPRPE
jgi:hypothetical protein